MVSDIKDTTPNEGTIKLLEEALENAKQGKVRTAVMLFGWDDDCVTSGYEIDPRNTPRRILAELLLLQLDFANHIGFDQQSSTIFRIVNQKD